MLINPVAGVEVLESREKYFIEHMDAQLVSGALQSKKVIPVHIQMKIMEAAERQEANYILFDYMFDVVLYMLHFSFVVLSGADM